MKSNFVYKRLNRSPPVGHFYSSFLAFSEENPVELLPDIVIRPTLMHTKNLYENGPNPFFSGFFNLMHTRMVQIRMAKSV